MTLRMLGRLPPYRDSMQMIINSCSTVIADEEVADIYLRAMQDFYSLSDVEQIRFHYVCCQRSHAASVNLSFKRICDEDSKNQIETELKPRTVA